MAMNVFRFGRRKIVGMHYTRYVALPHLWLRNWGLGKGDFVQVTLGKDGSLILRPILAQRVKKEVTTVEKI